MDVQSDEAMKARVDHLFDVFCTPEPLSEAAEKSVARIETRLAGAESLRVAFADGTLQAYRFRGAPEGETRGIVALLHGWTGRAAVMTAFVEPLTAQGFDVLALDFPAHGKSDGDRLHVPMGVAAVHAVQAVTGPWHGVIAHSFGGAVSYGAVSGLVNALPPLRVGRLVLVAAPSSMPRIFDHFAARHHLTPQETAYLKTHVRRLTGQPVEVFMGGDILRHVGLPTLVLHAPDDKEVIFENAEAFAAAGDHVRLIALPGLGHRRILYARETIAEAAAFMGGIM